MCNFSKHGWAPWRWCDYIETCRSYFNIVFKIITCAFVGDWKTLILFTGCWVAQYWQTDRQTWRTWQYNFANFRWNRAKKWAWKNILSELEHKKVCNWCTHRNAPYVMLWLCKKVAHCWRHRRRLSWLRHIFVWMTSAIRLLQLFTFCQVFSIYDYRMILIIIDYYRA